jgi:hypothetical protein
MSSVILVIPAFLQETFLIAHRFLWISWVMLHRDEIDYLNDSVWNDDTSLVNRTVDWVNQGLNIHLAIVDAPFAPIVASLKAK